MFWCRVTFSQRNFAWQTAANNFFFFRPDISGLPRAITTSNRRRSLTTMRVTACCTGSGRWDTKLPLLSEATWRRIGAIQAVSEPFGLGFLLENGSAQTCPVGAHFHGYRGCRTRFYSCIFSKSHGCG